MFISNLTHHFANRRVRDPYARWCERRTPSVSGGAVYSIKCRFFGQYLEQIIAKETKYPNSPNINTTTVLLINELSNYHLELKQLSKITDEDAQEIQRITGANHLPRQPLIYACLKKSDAIPVIDFLRSKGYALPFMEYSVEDLVSFGWVRLV